MATSEPMAGGTFERFDPEECKALVEAGEALLLDIREIHEFDAERIPGALLAPMQELQPYALPVGGGRRLILQCRSGGRTKKLAEAILTAGITDSIAHLEGGILAWKAEGLPTICPDPSRAVT